MINRAVLGMGVALWLLTSSAMAQRTVTVPEGVVAYPEMVVYNGKVAIMDDRSTNQTPGRFVQAMAVRDGKILSVGSDQEMVALAGPKTVKVDVHGRLVIPGIIDPHTHIHNNALSLYAKTHPEVLESVAKQFQVTGNTPAELKRGIEVVLKESMAHAKKDQWAFIGLPNGGQTGTGPGVKFIQSHDMTSQELDKLSPKNPVLLMSHPAYMTNTAGKAMLARIYDADPESILASDQNPDETQGYGDFIEYARSIMVDQYFHDKVQLLADIVGEELEKWSAAQGVTTFSSHIEGMAFLDAFNELDQAGKMSMRLAWSNYFGFEGNPDPAGFFLRLGDLAGQGTPYFWQSGVGLGNIDSGPPMFCSTMEGPPDAKKREWCKNRPGTAFEKGVYNALRSHERIAVGHLFGDKGLDYLIQTMERAMKDDPTLTVDYYRSRHFSTDHCGFYPRPEQLPVLKKYEFQLSCNGNIVNRSLPWLKVYGQQYAKWIVPVKSAIAAGIRTVYENEEAWAMEGEQTPSTYFDSAMFLLTRKAKDGTVVSPEEAVDRVTLMKMMTSWASEFVLKQDVLGTLEPGKWADFVVLNKDYFTVPEAEIAYLYPEMTVVGGKTTFLRTDLAAQLGRQPIGPQLKYKNVPKSDPFGLR